MGTLTLACVPLALVVQHPDYSPMLFRQLRHGQNVVNVSYWYKKYVCIYALCGTRTELLVGRARNSSACAIDMIWDELKRNSIEIDIETLSFHINICLREHEEIYGTGSSEKTVQDLKHIDLKKIYKCKRFISFKALLSQLLIRLVFAYFS